MLRAAIVEWLPYVAPTTIKSLDVLFTTHQLALRAIKASHLGPEDVSPAAKERWPATLAIATSRRFNHLALDWDCTKAFGQGLPLGPDYGPQECAGLAPLFGAPVWAVEAWAAQWHMPWLEGIAWQTVMMWAGAYPTNWHSLFVFRHHENEDANYQELPRLLAYHSVYGYNLLVEDRASFKARLNAYLGNVEQVCRTKWPGMAPPPQKDREHVKWFIKYQVLRMSPAASWTGR